MCSSKMARLAGQHTAAELIRQGSEVVILPDHGGERCVQLGDTQTHQAARSAARFRARSILATLFFQGHLRESWVAWLQVGAARSQRSAGLPSCRA